LCRDQRVSSIVCNSALRDGRLWLNMPDVV
jgi:hypothetical protein